MNPVWASTLGIALIAVAAGLVAWLAAGAAWAWAVVSAVLAFRVLYHAAHLAGLMAWLDRPSLRTLPQGSGVWEDALAGLHGYLKRRDAAEEGLMRALGRFRAAGRALPDGVVILDGEDRIEWSNPTAQRHFGIDPARDIGQPVTNLVRYPDFVSYLQRGDYREPLVLRHARSERVLSVRMIEFGAENKLLNSRDVTAEERLDTMRRDFVANVSHELKTPVTVLAGFVETLTDESIPLTEPQRKKYLGLMAEQAQRMRHLIEDLLTLSALESTAAPDDEEEIDMRPFVDKLLDEARALSAGRHRIEASVEPGGGLLGSARELRSAFSNLVSNAVRYTPEGGSIQLSWRIEGGIGVFAVSDTGIGIESRHLPRLTERFYRVDHSRSRETGGTGLGLAIVNHVLTRHEAALEIDSVLGRGSTFRAIFPARRLPQPLPSQDTITS
jgi:two-component system phosphate regulon sensor histidine kinase PhoR